MSSNDSEAPEKLKNKTKTTVPKKATSTLNGKQFVSQLTSMQRQITDEAINRTIIATNTKEIIELTKKISTLKARYVSGLLDIAKTPVSEISEKMEDLQTLRLTYEELEIGLDTLKEHISEGGMRIQGIS